MKTTILILLWHLGCGCGGSASNWQPADEKADRDIIHEQQLELDICGTPDGGCDPAIVRATARPAICLLASRLHAHGVDVDAGTGCQP